MQNSAKCDKISTWIIDVRAEADQDFKLLYAFLKYFRFLEIIEIFRSMLEYGEGRSN